MSALTECSAEPLGPEFPYADQWFAQFTLTRIFKTEFSRETVTSTFAVMRRAYSAMRSFDDGLSGVKAFLSERKIGAYFQALGAFEASLSSAYQGLVFAGKYIGEKLFDKGDSSELERMNRVYNVSRHYDPAKDLLPDHLHAVWLRNEGLHTGADALTFEEIRKWNHVLCKISDHMAKGEKPVHPYGRCSERCAPRR
ncbi:MAG: hypothetical protein ABUS79_05330 [Pseudomonadota bacterium]